MKATFAVLLCVLNCLSRLSAAEQESHWGFSYETQIRSEYLAKIGLVLYDHPILVQDIGVSYDNVFAGVWNSTGLGPEPYGSTFGDETDVYVGWSEQYDWIKFKALGSIFFLKHQDQIRDDIWVLEGEASFPTVPFVQPYLAVRHFGEISQYSPERGTFFWAGLRRSQPLGFKLGENDMVLNMDWMNGYSDGPFHRDPGFVFSRLTLDAPIKLGKYTTLVPSVLVQVPLPDQFSNDRFFTREVEVVGGLALKWKF